jgi:hypothetical protein
VVFIQEVSSKIKSLLPINISLVMGLATPEGVMIVAPHLGDKLPKFVQEGHFQPIVAITTIPFPESRAGST